MDDLCITVPVSSDPMVDRLRRRLKAETPRVITLEPSTIALPEHCYPNVNAFVRLYGGSRIDGWAIWQYERFFLEAEHHAVWKTPKGHLRCVTPQPQVDTKVILFCPCVYPSYIGKRIPPERLILSHEDDVSYYLSCVDGMNYVKYELVDRGITIDELMTDFRFLAAQQSVFDALARLRKSLT